MGWLLSLLYKTPFASQLNDVFASLTEKEAKLSQLLNELSEPNFVIEDNPLPIVTVLKLVQPANAEKSNRRTLFGIVILLRLLHAEKVRCSIEVRLFDSVK